MSTNINANVLKNFIVKTIGADKLTQNQAQKYDIDGNKYVEANKDENVEEQDKDKAAADKEKEKEEAAKVQDKGESKA